MQKIIPIRVHTLAVALGGVFWGGPLLTDALQPSMAQSIVPGAIAQSVQTRDPATTALLQQWRARQSGAWGLDNLSLLPTSGRQSGTPGSRARALRVRYPAGSVSPGYARSARAPLGGGQFFATMGITPQTGVRLRYSLRFSENFNFVRGGKLPGLFGGRGNSGGNRPNGTDGFSTRFMWRQNGEGEVYAYLPTSDRFGTSIGRSGWRFRPGVWHQLEQEVILNRPGQANGRIRVWLDGREVVNQGGLTFRSVDQLQIDGLFFSTFFGGDDRSWATPRDVHIDFADFSLTPVDTRSLR